MHVRRKAHQKITKNAKFCIEATFEQGGGHDVLSELAKTKGNLRGFMSKIQLVNTRWQTNNLEHYTVPIKKASFNYPGFYHPA